MRKMYVVAAREYSAAVKTKAFIIGLLLMPVMMGGSLVIQWFVKDIRDTKEKRFAIIDRTPKCTILPKIEEAVEKYNANVEDENGKQILPRFVIEEEKPQGSDEESLLAQRFELSQRVRKGELFGFIDIGPDVLTAKPVINNQRQGAPAGVNDRELIRYHSSRPTNQDFSLRAGEVISRAVQERRANKLSITVDDLKLASQPVPLASKGLLKRDREGQIQDAPASSMAAAFLIPSILIMLMFMTIMSGATPLMQGVVEEKMQRIAEVLLGSVSPFKLMFGKLIGMTGVSLTIGAVYLTGAYWSAHHFGFAENVPPELLVWFMVFQTLAALMYGALFIAIGAACSDMKETQSYLIPVMLLACLPLFVIVNVIQEPNGPIATGLSLFPLATPMLMIARMAIPPGLPWWQPALGVLLVLATTVLFVYIAGRIFRVGILMQGKGANLATLARWVLRG